MYRPNECRAAPTSTVFKTTARGYYRFDCRTNIESAARKGGVAGIVVGVVIGLCLLLVILYCLCGAKSDDEGDVVYVEEEPEVIYVQGEQEVVYVQGEQEVVYVEGEQEVVYVDDPNAQPEVVYQEE